MKAAPTPLEQFQALPLGDVWEDANLLECFEYLINSKHCRTYTCSLVLWWCWGMLIEFHFVLNWLPSIWNLVLREGFQQNGFTQFIAFMMTIVLQPLFCTDLNSWKSTSNAINNSSLGDWWYWSPSRTSEASNCKLSMQLRSIVFLWTWWWLIWNN